MKKSILQKLLCNRCNQELSVFEIEDLFRRKLALFALLVGILVQSVEVSYNYYLGQTILIIPNLFVLFLLIFVLIFFKKLPTKFITNSLVFSLVIKIFPVVFSFKESLLPWVILFPLISIVLVGIKPATFYTVSVGFFVFTVFILGEEKLTFHNFQFYLETFIAYITAFVIGSIYELLNRYFYAQLKRQALKDFLTGLFNRRYFDEILRWEIEFSKRYKHPLSIILFDIDDFKCINDKYGHQFGDQVLKVIAELTKKHIRSSDVPARYGGEEFIILLPETDLKGAVKVAEKLRHIIETSPIDGVKITASFGVTELLDGDTLDSLIERADKALYQAKRQGKNKVVYLTTNKERSGNCKKEKTD